MYNILNSQYIIKLDEWYNSTKEALLLYGNSGSGKSYLITKYLEYKNYQLFTYSIIETKNKKSLVDLLKDIIKTPVITDIFNNIIRYSAIIIDDIDFTLIQKNDIIDLLEFKKKNPKYNTKIILITNTHYNLGVLKKYLFILNILKPTNIELFKLGNSVLNDTSKLNDIVIKSENDYRKFNYLCNIYSSNINIYNKKDNNDDIYEYTNKLYNNYEPCKDTKYYNDNNLIYNMLYKNTYNNIIINSNNNNIDKINILNNIYNSYIDINYLKLNEKISERFDNYVIYYGIKNISYNYNKLNKNAKINELNYPKNISIYNNKNLYIKNKYLFNKLPIYFNLKYINYNLLLEYLFTLKRTNNKQFNIYINTFSIDIKILTNILDRYSIINNIKK